MSLKVMLLEDMKNAMKEKDEIKKNTIQLIRSAILQVEKDAQTELDDNKVLEIIFKEAKKRKDSIVEFEKASRQDIIDQIHKELDVISKYLPKEMSKEELTSIIKETIEEVGAKDMKDMGKVMQSVKSKVGVRADGKQINEIVKSLL